ncbi:hypothetical protein QQ045_008467 [Rhodiola kirilowii]
MRIRGMNDQLAWGICVTVRTLIDLFTPYTPTSSQELILINCLQVVGPESRTRTPFDTLTTLLGMYHQLGCSSGLLHI